jgi:hypothetical protein
VLFNKEKDQVVLLADWPQPSAGATQPTVSADDCSLTLRYRTDDDRPVVIHFPLCTYLIFGAPNDEALGGHPLAKRGLKHYSVHEIHESSLIQELERRNSIHPRHSRKRYLEGLRHLIFTFHDSTLECVVDDTEHFRPEINLT